MSDERIISVGELTRQIKGVLELGFPNQWVQGEISNCKHHTSGHLYFTLKDEQAQISAVMWRSRVGQLRFRPADGMKVMVRGNVTLYEPRGNYQLDCQSIQPLGKGDLQIAFEQLKERLQKEGLFDTARKRPLPKYPQRIGIVTSPTGAAVQDMISVLTRRFPSVELIIVPVKVQGAGAAEEIAGAIGLLNDEKMADVMIVGRGGGSLEDLWAFNEEVVARAIVDSRIPVVSAVGHEVDFSISDFASDLRAPTPSAAAELVVKDAREVVELIRNYCYTMTSAMNSAVDAHKQTIAHLTQSYSFNRPHDLLRQRSQHVDELHRRLEQGLQHRFAMVKQHTVSLNGRIRTLDPTLVLKRGYAIVRQGERIISSVSGITPGPASVQFHDGTAEAELTQRKKK